MKEYRMLKFEMKAKKFHSPSPILDKHRALYISVPVILFGEWFAGFHSVTLLVLKVPKKPIMLVND
jgi:hypothetical protein